MDTKKPAAAAGTMSKQLSTLVKFGLKQALLLAASVVVIFCTVQLESHRGPDNPAEGAHVFYGFPFAFKECAPGWAWCQWHMTFWVDVLIAYAVLALLVNLAMRRSSRR